MKFIARIWIIFSITFFMNQRALACEFMSLNPSSFPNVVSVEVKGRVWGALLLDEVLRVQVLELHQFAAGVQTFERQLKPIVQSMTKTLAEKYNIVDLIALEREVTFAIVSPDTVQVLKGDFAFLSKSYPSQAQLVELIRANEKTNMEFSERAKRARNYTNSETSILASFEYREMAKSLDFHPLRYAFWELAMSLRRRSFYTEAELAAGNELRKRIRDQIELSAVDLEDRFQSAFQSIIWIDAQN